MTHLQKLCFAYLSGRIEPELFQDWFAQLYVEVANGQHEADARAARRIGLRLAEFTNGDVSESAVKAEIRKHAQVAPITFFVEAQPRVKTGASQASLVERLVAFA